MLAGDVPAARRGRGAELRAWDFVHCPRSDSTFRSEVLGEGLALLDERERIVIALRFGLDGTEPKTLEEIGRRLGFSRERARQLESKALKRLAQLSEMEPLAATAK